MNPMISDKVITKELNTVNDSILENVFDRVYLLS